MRDRESPRFSLTRFLTLEVPARIGITRSYRAKRRAMRELGYEKVFGIGAPKTGTTSLAAAFEILGFRHTGWDPRLWQSFEQGEYGPIFSVAERFEAFEDGPWNGDRFYEELDARFPGSKFVLTVRDSETWLRSHERHFSSEGARRIPERYWIVDYERQRDQFLKEYERRNGDVVARFHERPDQLLVLDVCGGDGWARLCPFLGVPIPDRPFPHRNRTGQPVYELANR